MHNHPTPKFSIITVTYNAEAVLEDTIQSVISQTYHHVEYIIVDGASKDSTLSIIDRYRDRITRIVSEPDKGLYDAMNKGITMAQGKFALFLNSGDIFHQDAANFVRKLKMHKDNMMITGDAMLDFGDGHKIKRSAKPGWYIYHCLPASHQAIFFPVSGLKKWRYDLEYKVSSDYALAAKMYKAGYAFKKLNGLVSEFSMGGVSTTNNMELCADAKKVQRQILHVPGFWAELSWHLRQRTTSKTKALYNKS
mgnify:CR=1 FL=1